MRLYTLLNKIMTRLISEKDFVLEQGTSGIWTYRKWNSGIAECFGTKTSNENYLESSFGGYTSNILSTNFPLTFSKSPVAIVSCDTDNRCIVGLVYTSNSAVSCRIINNTNGTGIGTRISYRVIGKWK